MDNVAVRVNNSAPNRNNSSKKFKLSAKQAAAVVITVLIGAIIALAVWSFYRTSTSAAIDGSKYQAVFFTNGQVYFGKLTSLNGGYMKLTDIYYLQAQTTNTDNKSENPQQTSEQANSDVQLIKLGNEVHGPVDEMIISKDQVLFFENLKGDGKVSESITKYKTEKK